jgi:hypothetical protein
MSAYDPKQTLVTLRRHASKTRQLGCKSRVIVQRACTAATWLASTPIQTARVAQLLQFRKPRHICRETAGCVPRRLCTRARMHAPNHFM